MQLEDFVKENKVENKVIFHESVSDASVPKYAAMRARVKEACLIENWSQNYDKSNNWALRKEYCGNY